MVGSTQQSAGRLAIWAALFTPHARGFRAEVGAIEPTSVIMAKGIGGGKKRAGPS
jgi:hypothetical protein